jgi:CO/xanthine dehydrogenase Mo-binding subunit
MNLAYRLAAEGSLQSGGATLAGSLQVNRRLNQWLAFERDESDRCWVVIKPGKVEIGQGIHTALVQLAAEELGVHPDQIKIQAVSTQASPDEAVTSGSLSIQECGTAVRHACAQARQVLLAEISLRENHPSHLLTVRNGTVFERDSAPICTYWDLPTDALLDREATVVSPLSEAPKQWIGKSLPRLDLPAKFRGQAVFIHDLRMPSMRYAFVIRGAFQKECIAAVTIREATMSKATIMQDHDFVAVIAEQLSHMVRLQNLCTLTQAKHRANLSPSATTLNQWLDQAVLNVASTVVVDRAAEHPSGHEPALGVSLKQTFEKPWLAHASIGLSCAVACFDPTTGLRVLTHSQGIFNLRKDLHLVFGKQLNLEQIVVEHVQGAGCYGHNGADDVAFDAARVAMAHPGLPIRLQWSRAQELADAPFSPAMRVEVAASLDQQAQPMIAQWKQTLWSNGHSSRPGRAPTSTLLGASEIAAGSPPLTSMNPPLAAGGGADRNSVPGYAIAQLKVENHRFVEMPVRSSAFRGLGAIANVFAIESMMDDLAAASDQDVMQFRLRHLSTDTRALAVIQAAAAISQWSANDDSLGMAYARYKNTGAWCCVIAKVFCEEKVKVQKLWVVADVGFAINPDGVVNQLEGGAIQACSIALLEDARFALDPSVTPDWENYPILRFSEVPRVAVSLVNAQADLPSLGAGEAATAPVVAAIANAVNRNLGIRVKRLPLTPETIAAAISDSSETISNG